MEYSARIDWQINNNIKQELVKRWIDITKLRINTTKGVVEIGGDLNFTGKAADDTEAMAIITKLKRLDQTLRGITYVRDIQWRLNNWSRVGQRWNPSKAMEKQLKKKQQ